MAVGRAEYRYGLVALIVLALAIFEILAPDADWARAILVALAGAALTVAVATSRAPGSIRRKRARVVGGVSLLVVLGVATGVLSAAVTFAVLALVIALILITIVRGLLQLVREKGVHLHAVAGGLALYLLGGLLFASVIAFIAHVETGYYFVQGAHIPNGTHVYYSFTVLTTTGFGDYTAAHPVGHALAVLEMLTGQLYLVTVIGVMIGVYVSRRT
jgi:hypothetical protein